MKLLFYLLVLCSIGAKAQSDLKFDQSMLNCEDKWIAIAANDSLNFYFGFVYLDNSAGLTFRLEGTFFVNNYVKYLPRKGNEEMIRLGPSKVAAAIIPINRLADLGVSEKPEWLALYKTDDTNVDRLFRLANTYNMWGDPNKALFYLNQVKKKDRDYPGLNKEYYIAYNGKKNRPALTQHYLGEAIYDADDARQTNCELYKSLVFKHANDIKLKEAEEMYFYAIKECTDEIAKADMAYNIAYKYYRLLNKEKLKQWATEVKRWIVPNDSYAEKVQKMTEALN